MTSYQVRKASALLIFSVFLNLLALPSSAFAIQSCDGPYCESTCPVGSLKATPGICGCNVLDVNSDGDEFVDCIDACPNDSSKFSGSGQCGCGVSEINSDDDKVADCNDECPFNSSKTAPGICGCDQQDSETDTDQDGTPNCVDQCPEDSAKISAGRCGCGSQDIDSDGDSVADCVDACPNDSGKTDLGVCGCGTPDGNQESRIEGNLQCGCSAVCDLENPLRDDDNDGRSNCDELDEGTLPCDSGSFIPKISPAACAAANGFFSINGLPPPNIATVINYQSVPLNVVVKYTNLKGIEKGSVSFLLPGLVKRDIIVNELGLESESYGTVCVTTDAPVRGAWGGGVTIYKTENQQRARFDNQDRFDFALFYPFSDPQRGHTVLPLNTNVVGNDTKGLVANWISITDGVSGDKKGLTGKLYYYSPDGEPITVDRTGKKFGPHESVNIPDGGRFDFAGHEKLPFRGIGFAEFVPDFEDQTYYLESSRFFYIDKDAAETNFLTAFNLPQRPPTGARTTGLISREENVLSIIEIVNAKPTPVAAQLKIFSESGIQQASGSSELAIPAKGSRHVIVNDNVLSANTIGSAQTTGPVESVSAVSVFYQFDGKGTLQFAYAPAFSESPGIVQITDFNTFIGNKNRLRVHNSENKKVTLSINGIDFLGKAVPGLTGLTVDLLPRATRVIDLDLPADLYGTITVDANGETGLVLRNDILRSGNYILAFPGQ